LCKARAIQTANLARITALEEDKAALEELVDELGGELN
jgi:hypothetical protein